MKSPPSYQESRNQFKINNEQQEQRQAQPQRPYQQSDLIYEHQNTSKLNQATTTAASSKIQNQNNLNFKQYFEGLKHAKKRDTPIQDDPSLSSSSTSSSPSAYALLNPSYEDLNSNSSTNTNSTSNTCNFQQHQQQAQFANSLAEQQKRHKLIKFSNSISKLHEEEQRQSNSNHFEYLSSPVKSRQSMSNQNNQLLMQQKQKQQSLKFTSEIEKELSNLTLSIEKEMEKQKLQQQQQQLNSKQIEYYGSCFKCNKPVYSREEAVLAMSNIYHSCCFVCVSCGRQLKGKSFYHLNNQVYCEEDYLYSGFLENAEKCDICGHIIVDMILQAMGKSYHPGCFRCFSCNECLDGLPFTLDINNHVYCIKDYYRLYAPKCAACHQAITPLEGTNETVRIVSMENDFHIDCYVCEDCGTQLTDEQDKRCYPLAKSLLCYVCHVKRIELNQLDHILLNNLSHAKPNQSVNVFNSSTPTQVRSNFHFQSNGQNDFILSSKRNLQTENL